ncbi:hypothetical protein EOM39_01220 [Candidatus Gracilibacteria bacterium]|nr:hypothetical protein [Candidatus Gracilibacteria bacterium]
MTDTTINKNPKKITSKIYPLDILIYQRVKYFVEQKDGFCYESNLSLSKALNRSTQRISMSISKLIKLGYLINNGTIQQRELKITEKKLNYYFNKNDIDFNKNDIDFNKINTTTLTQILLYFNKNDKETLTKAIRDFNKTAMQVLDIVLDINKESKELSIKEKENFSFLNEEEEEKERKRKEFEYYEKKAEERRKQDEEKKIKEKEEFKKNKIKAEEYRKNNIDRIYKQIKESHDIEEINKLFQSIEHKIPKDLFFANDERKRVIKEIEDIELEKKKKRTLEFLQRSQYEAQYGLGKSSISLYFNIKNYGIGKNIGYFKGR